MNLTRLFITYYRKILCKIYKRQQIGVMKSGILCDVEKFNFEINHGDIIHPCIRFSEERFNGYNWWMIYTPYYNANATLENPILCYGISNQNKAPVQWNIHSLIRKTPLRGYNSDPTILFENNKLYIFWRENDTPNTQNDKIYRGTYGAVLSNNRIIYLKKPILKETDKNFDKEVSPTFIHYKNKYRAYAAHLRFKNEGFHFKELMVNKITSKLLNILSVLEIYHEQKSLGISIWESDDLTSEFTYVKTVQFKNLNKLYRPWHMDFFEYNNVLYSIVQTNQSNADICLAFSTDYETFTLFDKPLVTQHDIKKIGIYKPTGLVIDGVFYLYYTAQDIHNRGLNSLYMSEIKFSNLLEMLK